MDTLSKVGHRLIQLLTWRAEKEKGLLFCPRRGEGRVELINNDKIVNDSLFRNVDRQMQSSVRRSRRLTVVGSCHTQTTRGIMKYL